jgi:ABC-2 type transport system permease protein
MDFIRYAIKNSFLSKTAYRTNTIVSIISSAFGLLIQIAIWTALYNGRPYVQTGSETTIYISDMVQYAVLSALLTILINNNVISNIEQRIVSGQVSIDFIRPVGFSVQVICSEIGNVLFNAVFTFLPMVVISLLLVGAKVFVIRNLFIFLLTLFNSIILFYAINYLIGLLSFWFLTIWPLRQILDGVIKLLSGALIPLWFLPKGIFSVAYFLPFRLIYYFPISVALQKTSVREMLESILLQYFWIAFFVTLCAVLWNRGNKKLTVQGG